MISRRISATLALALPLTALAHGAQADCQDTGTVDAPVVTCDLQPGFETDGIDDNRDDLTLEVLQGAVVTATGITVVQLSGDDGFVDNAGTISGSGDAIFFENAQRSPDLEIVNQPSGSLVSTAARGVNGEDFLRLENKGLISAQGDAVRLNGGGDVENRNRGALVSCVGCDPENFVFGFPVFRDSARIESATGFGIVAEDPALVINFGQIDSFKDGIRAEGFALISNGSDRVIAETFFSRSADARITVTGTQVVDGETVGFAGINANPSGSADGGAEIDNFGEILATGPGIVQRGGLNTTFISNAGRIESLMDDGVRLGDGELENSASLRVDSPPEIVGAKAGVSIDSGFIFNSSVIRSTGTAPDSAGIRVDGVDANGDAASPLEINNEGSFFDRPGGTIRGMIGILFDEASTAEQQIFNAGVIEGIGGTAIRFAPGQGASTLTLAGESQIIGDVIFGSANDLLVVEQITSGVLINSTFDGGGGFDTADLSAYSLSDLSNLALDDDETLSFDLRAANGDLLSASFTRFEAFILSDTSFGPMSLPFAGGAGGSGITPIPVPPALPLLGAAVAGLALVRRRAS